MADTAKERKMIPPKRLSDAQSVECIAKLKTLLEHAGEHKEVNVRELAAEFQCQVDAIYDVYAKNAPAIGLVRFVDLKRKVEKTDKHLSVSGRLGIQIPKKQLQRLNLQLESRHLSQYSVGDAVQVNICENGNLLISHVGGR